MNISLIFKNHTTSDAVMEVMDSIYQCWDNHEATMGIFLDLQKVLNRKSLYPAKKTRNIWHHRY